MALMMGSSRQLSSNGGRRFARSRARKRVSKTRGEVDRPRNRLCRVTLCNELQLGASSRRGEASFLESESRLAVSLQRRRKKVVTEEKIKGEICFPTFAIMMRFDVFYLVFLCRSLVVVTKC
ncbi:hypothetical protein G5I_07004 [Acromyrmex echinatior]|uniref:Uncharacterized protein n=1 Tax=Acromyrmex echinatior TaxID=103372 RepID=F4WMM1_ACREC|nr:hypothetical protein G5I_07004 [Acromyrmex echinatior]